MSKGRTMLFWSWALLCVMCCQMFKQEKGAETWLRVCTVDGGEWSASCSGHFTHRERVLSTHSVGGWYGFQHRSGVIVKRKISTWYCVLFFPPVAGLAYKLNPLPVQFKSPLHVKKGCVFSAGILIYVLHQKQVSPPGKKKIITN